MHLFEFDMSNRYIYDDIRLYKNFDIVKNVMNDNIMNGSDGFL